MSNINKKKRSGRPKKLESEKVQYQRIAVYFKDYDRLMAKIETVNEVTERQNAIIAKENEQIQNINEKILLDNKKYNKKTPCIDLKPLWPKLKLIDAFTDMVDNYY